MSPTLFGLTFAVMLALATLATARRNPLPAGPPAVAVLVLLLSVGGFLFNEVFSFWAMGLAAVGLLLPGLVLARVRRHSARGDYSAAARLLEHMQRVRRSPALARWVLVWRAAARVAEGDNEPADALIVRFAGQPKARASRDWLLGIRWRWADVVPDDGPNPRPAVKAKHSPDLIVRALCEQGLVEAALIGCADRLAERGGPGATARRRVEWLAPIAFSGRVAATEVLCGLLSLPTALTQAWRAVALSAAGQPDEARAALDAAERRPDLTAGLRYVLGMRRAHLPAMPSLSATARGLVERVEREILAGSVLRIRAPWRSPQTIALLVGLFAVFSLQSFRGPTTDPEVALALGALEPRGGFPAEPMRLITHAFLHAGPLHLLVNVFTIAVVGATVEATVGGLRLVLIFVGSAVGGGLAISYLGANEVTLGASGAAMGLLSALGVIAAGDRRTRGTMTGRHLSLALLALVVAQSLLDAAMPEISLAGHLGGAISGALLALLPRSRPQ